MLNAVSLSAGDHGLGDRYPVRAAGVDVGGAAAHRADAVHVLGRRGAAESGHPTLGRDENSIVHAALADDLHHALAELGVRGSPYQGVCPSRNLHVGSALAIVATDCSACLRRLGKAGLSGLMRGRFHQDSMPQSANGVRVSASRA